MTIYTQAELDGLTDEEYAQFLIDGLLVDDDEPFYWEKLATYTDYAEVA